MELLASISRNSIVILEYLATAAFALSGVLGALRKRMDIVGICACGFLAAFGGGTLRDVLLEQPPIVAVMMGVITGTFGGVLRDLVCNEIPELFRDHRPYALCAAAGAIAYLLGALAGAPSALSMTLCASVTIGLRWLALHFDLKLPPAG